MKVLNQLYNHIDVQCIPFHIRKQIESELETLKKLDIIERLDGPTP